jgi:hypothetical protein
MLAEEGLSEIANDQSRTLDDLLQCRNGSYLVISAVGADSWSGRLHSRLSPSFTAADVREVAFKRAERGWRQSAERKVVAWKRKARQRLNDGRVAKYPNLGFDDNERKNHETDS